jgi:type II secretory pathway predicted ATPase ExeA
MAPDLEDSRREDGAKRGRLPTLKRSETVAKFVRNPSGRIIQGAGEMYEASFHLHGRPFVPTPRVDLYFPAAAIENARQALARSIERGEGPGLVIGPPGTGKTLLLHVLAQQFDGAFSVVQLTGGRLATRVALLQTILYELALPYRGLDEGELRLALIDAVEPTSDGQSGLLLLVDEAHTLPLRVLEELRMITNLVRDGQPRVRLVLAGGPVLEERFASPKLSSLAQRLAARCYLEALSAGETAAYVRAQIKAVGGEPSRLVDDAAMQAIFRATDGIPRLINQVCDHALLLASLGGADGLSSEAIEEAWADLQQLPTPWSGGSHDVAAANVVEFGQLSEAGDEMPEAIPFRPSDARPLHIARAAEPGLAKLPEDAGPHLELSGTEVDLEFPEFGDALSEEFEEEEVVLDRYASDVEIFADVPRVTSWESRQLASLLEPLDVSTPRRADADEATIKFAAVYPADESSVATGPLAPFAAEGIVCTPPGDYAVVPSAGAQPPDASQRAPAADLSAFWAGAKVGDSAGNLIIVEDRGPPGGPQPPRKREYRQLFAKLRRG